MATIFFLFGSTIQRSRSCPLGLRIINNYLHFFSFWVNHTAKQIVPFRAKNYQQLPTIIFGVVNHTAQQIVPFRAKNYQQLLTICKRVFKGSTIQRSRSCPLGLRISNNYQQLFWSAQPYIGSDMPVAQKNEITGFQWQ